MDETIRNTAWAIAEAWWRKLDQIGAPMEGASSTEYADAYWETWVPEARAALNVRGLNGEPHDLASQGRREPSQAIHERDIVTIRRFIHA
jgi:hypothetical protein